MKNEGKKKNIISQGSDMLVAHKITKRQKCNEYKAKESAGQIKVVAMTTVWY